MSIYGKKYPWLRLRDLYSGEIDTGHDVMDDMPGGWRKVFCEHCNGRGVVDVPSQEFKEDSNV